MDGTGLGALVSSGTTLILLLLLLIGATMLVRRIRATGWAQRNAPQSPIEILAARPLGNQTTLILAQSNGHRFLIGVSRSGITAIGRVGGGE